MLSAAVLFDRAVEHGNAGRHAVARRMLGLASDRADDADLSARIDGTLAYLEAETGDPDRGLQRCSAALLTPGISSHTNAVLTSQLGLIELRRGDLDAALPHLNTGVDELAADPARLGRVVLNRGLVYLERGDIRRSERDFASAADAFERTGDTVERAKAQHNQGYAALIGGDLVSALRLMDEARGVLAALSPVSLAICDLDRAEALRTAGMTSAAIDSLETVVRTFGSRRLRQMQADAEYTLAGALLDSLPTRAAGVARRAARRYRLRGNETAALRADACAVTGAVLAGSGGKALRAETARVAAALRERNLTVDATAVELQLARLDLRSGDPSSVPVADATSPITTRLLSREIRAEFAEVLGRSTGVLDEARAGLDELHEWQATFGSIDLLSSTAARGRNLALVGIRAAVSSGDPRTVFEWSERTRSLAGRIVAVRPPSDPRAAAELTELRALRVVGADAVRESELRESIRRRRWSEVGSGGVGTIPSLESARAELGDSGADFVAFLWSGDRLTALVVGADVVIVDLGPWHPIAAMLDGLLADLDASAADLPPGMAAVVLASLANRLAELDAVLIAPLDCHLTSSRLVISVPGVLSGVPWGALPTLAGTAITLPGSVDTWLQSRRVPLTLASAGFVAGPDVGRAELEVTRSAAEWANAEVLMRGDATAAASGELATRVDVLHVSAHGRHSADNPLFSGIELADGPWFGYDIDRLPVLPPVVVLSACELGRSGTGWGRESLGMAQSWLHAGSRCVIAAPASVNDHVAEDVLTRVHSRLAIGAAPSDALAEAAVAAGVPTTFQVYGAGW